MCIRKFVIWIYLYILLSKSPQFACICLFHCLIRVICFVFVHLGAKIFCLRDCLATPPISKSDHCSSGHRCRQNEMRINAWAISIFPLIILEISNGQKNFDSIFVEWDSFLFRLFPNRGFLLCFERLHWFSFVSCSVSILHKVFIPCPMRTRFSSPPPHVLIHHRPILHHHPILHPLTTDASRFEKLANPLQPNQFLWPIHDDNGPSNTYPVCVWSPHWSSFSLILLRTVAYLQQDGIFSHSPLIIYPCWILSSHRRIKSFEIHSWWSQIRVPPVVRKRTPKPTDASCLKSMQLATSAFTGWLSASIYSTE